MQINFADDFTHGRRPGPGGYCHCKPVLMLRYHMPLSLIVLTDFFLAANRALDYATNLAGALGARLVLLHVRRDSVLDPEMFTGQLSNLSKEAIALALNSVSHNLAVPVVAEVGHGVVASAAADAASRHHPALIVLGRPDLSRTPDEAVHTTALDLLRLAPFPMLMVPHALANCAMPRRVLLAVDGEPFVLSQGGSAAQHLLQTLHARLTVLHIASDGADADHSAAALESVLESGLTADLPPVKTLTLVRAHTAEGILAVAQAVEFDLLVLIARQHSFLGQLFHRSVTAHVLVHSAIPVLVLPAQ